MNNDIYNNNNNNNSNNNNNMVIREIYIYIKIYKYSWCSVLMGGEWVATPVSSGSASRSLDLLAVGLGIGCPLTLSARPGTCGTMSLLLFARRLMTQHHYFDFKCSVF